MDLTTNSKGSALVLVIGLTGVLFLGCIFLYKVAKECIRSSQSLMDKLSAQMVAESTLERLKFLGPTGRFVFNRLKNEFAEEIGVDQELPLDGTSIRLPNKTRVIALDAGAKLNVWTGDSLYAARAVQAVTGKDSGGSEIRDSLEDWFDEDDLQRLNGAESYYYQTERHCAFGPRNYRAPQCSDELSLVKGLHDPNVWSSVRDLFILAPGVLPNINTMPGPTLRAVLGITPETAEELLSLRANRGYLSFWDVSAVSGIDIAYLMENCALSPSGVLELSIETVVGDARHSIQCLVAFRPDQSAPFRVLEYKD